MQSQPGSSFAGCHVLAEFTGVARELADDRVRLRHLLRTALERAGATVCDMVDKRFEPHGVTVLALLAESHASIHSYPERGAMFVDVFTCGESANAEEAVRLLRQAVGAADAHVHTVFRGAGKQIVEPMAAGITRNWQLTDVLCDVHTEFQHLVIGRTEQGISLFSDSDRQSTELSQLVYHEALMVPAMLLAETIDRLLIIGSGEGVASQMAVAAGATHVDHIDIDRDAVRLCAEHLPYGYTPDELARAEAGLGPVTVHYTDGYEFVATHTGPRYDVVVIDLPDERPEPAQHNRLYGADFMELCGDIGAIVVGQAGCPTLWRNETLLRSWERFGETFGTVTYFGSDEHEWAFLSGVTGVLEDPLATMTARLETLPYRPSSIDAAALASATTPPMSLRGNKIDAASTDCAAHASRLVAGANR